MNQISVAGKKDNIDFDNFTTIDQVILQIILILESVLPLENLIECTKLVNKNLFGNELSYEIYNRILVLEQIHIIKNEQSRIAIYHDLMYYALSDHFKNSLIEKQLSFIILKYISDLNNDERTFVLNNKADYFIAKLSFLSNKNDWKNIVFKYFNNLFNKNEIYEAKMGFDWLQTYLFELPIEQQITIATCYYECGEYNNALTIINHIERHDLEQLDNISFDYYYLKGKIENVLMDKLESVKSLKKAYSLSNTLDQKILALNMQQLVLVEIFGKKEEAKELFRYV